MFIYIWESKAKREILFAKENALLLLACLNEIDWHLSVAYHDYSEAFLNLQTEARQLLHVKNTFK